MDPDGSHFHWIPLLVLFAWFVWCAFLYVQGSSGGPVWDPHRTLDRSRRFARLFSSVPAWHRRAFDHALASTVDPGRDRLWHALDHEARALAIRHGIQWPGARERFTVACLWFYDHPIELRDTWPELYHQMEVTLGSDPATRAELPPATRAA